MMPTTISSETSAPDSITALALRPIGVPAFDGGAQHVACGELRDAVLLDQPRRLRAFAGAGRPEQYQPHLFLPLNFALRIRLSY